MPYYLAKTSGHYLGARTIIRAENEASALALLGPCLSEHGLWDHEPYEFEELDFDTTPAICVFNGDY